MSNLLTIAIVEIWNNDRPAWLHHYNEIADIAIFHARPLADLEDGHQTLKMEHLLALPNPTPTQPVWAVAYSARDPPLEPSDLGLSKPLSVDK